MHHVYIVYPLETNSTVFTVLAAIKWAKFYLSGTIITYVTLFSYSGTRGMGFDWFDDGGNSEDNDFVLGADINYISNV